MDKQGGAPLRGAAPCGPTQGLSWLGRAILLHSANQAAQRRIGVQIARGFEAGPQTELEQSKLHTTDGQGPPQMPPWIPRLLGLLVLTVLGTLALLFVIRELSGFIGSVVVALFASFALEPAVNWLAGKGWKRGPATLLVLAAAGAAIAVVVGTVVPLLIQELQALIGSIPSWLEEVDPFLQRWFGVTLSESWATAQSQDLLGMLAGWGAGIAGNVVGLAGDVVGAVFQIFTVALFSFYFIAEGPQLRRALLSMFRPHRQQDVLRTWDVAVEKTGGYLYSRLLLALISALFTFVMLTILRLPSALPLAIWVGVISQFIPTVGTYLAAIIPLILALVDSPLKALVVLIFFVVYQQVENYLFAPRITAQTMNMHPAVAFGSVIVGSALFGAIGALLAIPGAAILQALVWTSLSRYKVAEDGIGVMTPGNRPGAPWRRLAAHLRRRGRSGGSGE